MKYLEWEKEGLRYLVVLDGPSNRFNSRVAVYSQILSRKTWRYNDQCYIELNGREAILHLSELVAPDGWQEGTDDMLTNTEQVMETRIDYQTWRHEGRQEKL